MNFLDKVFYSGIAFMVLGLVVVIVAFVIQANPEPCPKCESFTPQGLLKMPIEMAPEPGMVLKADEKTGGLKWVKEAPMPEHPPRPTGSGGAGGPLMPGGAWIQVTPAQGGHDTNQVNP